MKIEATEFLMEQYGLWVWRDNGTPRCSSPLLAMMLRNPANQKRPKIGIYRQAKNATTILYVADFTAGPNLRDKIKHPDPLPAGWSP